MMKFYRWLLIMTLSIRRRWGEGERQTTAKVMAGAIAYREKEKNGRGKE
jgi:hypothetical protein